MAKANPKLRLNLRVNDNKIDRSGLFRSLSHMLYRDPERGEIVRQNILHFLNENPGFFESKNQKEDASRIISEIGALGRWNQELELKAACEAYKVKIQVLLPGYRSRNYIPRKQVTQKIQLLFHEGRYRAAFIMSTSSPTYYMPKRTEDPVSENMKIRHLEQRHGNKAILLPKSPLRLYKAVSAALFNNEHCGRVIQRAARVELINNLDFYTPFLGAGEFPEFIDIERRIVYPNGEFSKCELQILSNAMEITIILQNLETGESIATLPRGEILPLGTLHLFTSGETSYVLSQISSNGLTPSLKLNTKVHNGFLNRSNLYQCLSLLVHGNAEDVDLVRSGVVKYMKDNEYGIRKRTGFAEVGQQVASFGEFGKLVDLMAASHTYKVGIHVHIPSVGKMGIINDKIKPYRQAVELEINDGVFHPKVGLPTPISATTQSNSLYRCLSKAFFNNEEDYEMLQLAATVEFINNSSKYKHMLHNGQFKDMLDLELNLTNCTDKASDDLVQISANAHGCYIEVAENESAKLFEPKVPVYPVYTIKLKARDTYDLEGMVETNLETLRQPNKSNKTRKRKLSTT